MSEERRSGRIRVLGFESGGRLTLTRAMPNKMKSCAPLAVAPEGRGCEGAIGPLAR